MKKNGFTLIEIIGAIIILSIIAVIAFSTYTSSLRGFRENYYTSLVRTLDESGEEFFNDFRNYRPNKLLNAQKVTLSTLQTKNYLSKVSDYNGKSCENSSYVLIVKEGRNKYTYHTCLRCVDDDYDNTEDMYCDSSWLDPTKVVFTLGEMEDLYVYKGTLRDELEEKLKLPVSYTRIDYDGKVLKSIRGTGEGEPVILPKNMDAVNTNVEGTYELEYEYKDEKKTRKVIVYENESPTITYRRRQTVLTKLDGTTRTYVENYNGEWSQEIIVNLSSKDFIEAGVETKEFQWNKGGRWQEFCTEDPCQVDVDIEMNEDIQFRLVDTNGKISRTTNTVTFKIDNTKPRCGLKKKGTIGEEEWYVSNVNVSFTEKIDQDNDNHIQSGVNRYNIYLSGSSLPENRNSIGTNNNITHTEDISSVSYTGYIEDAAENYNTCDISFKKDATAPVCSVSGHAMISCTDSMSKVNRWYYKIDAPGTYTTVTATESLSVDASSNVTSSGKYYLYAKDVAGNVSTVRDYTYYDVTYNYTTNGGTIPVIPNTNPAVTKTSDIIRNGNTADLTPTSTKAGYSFDGWNSSSTATSGYTSCPATTKNDIGCPVTSNVTLYTIFKECPNGYYNVNSTTCTQCPEGYRNGTTLANKTSQSVCLKSVNCGYYVKNANDVNATKCGTGTYMAAHGVTYGNTSTCTLCTTLGSNYTKSAEGSCQASNCYMSVGGGKYKTAATGNNTDNCSAGYAKAAHDSYYGTADSCSACGCGKYSAAGASSCSSISAGCYGTSAGTACPNTCGTGTYSTGGVCQCTNCPEGYRDGAGTTAQSSCIKSVSAGYHVGTANGAATQCDCGYAKAAHNVSYGNTSSCDVCPANKYSAAGASICTDCASGKTSPAGACTCVDAGSPPTVALRFIKHSATDGSSCGVGDESRQDSTGTTICRVCNGTSCGTEWNCALYSLKITPSSGRTIKSVTVSFTKDPGVFVEKTNTYTGAMSSLPTFGLKTYYVSNCNATNCENGLGTNYNFFKNSDGTAIHFRFRPSAVNNGDTVSGTVTVTYDNDVVKSTSFSYSVTCYMGNNNRTNYS